MATADGCEDNAPLSSIVANRTPNFKRVLLITCNANDHLVNAGKS